MEILIGLLLCIVVALIPILIYGWFINWLDQHEKEPWWILFFALLWGAIPAVFIALIAQILLDIPTTWVVGDVGLGYDLIGAALWAPITEEICKGIGLLLILWLAYQEFDNILDGIIYGAMIGLGFAFTEDIFYFIGALAESGLGAWAFVVLLRTIPFGLNHAFFTGVFGAALGWIVTTPRSGWFKGGIALLGLIGAMFFHSLHNLGATLVVTNCLWLFFSLVADWGGILLLGILITLIWREEKRWITNQLADDLTPESFQLMTSWKSWQLTRWRALLKADFSAWHRLGRMRQIGAELAFKRQQQELLGPKPELEQTIKKYRIELIKLGAISPAPLSHTKSE